MYIIVYETYLYIYDICQVPERVARVFSGRRFLIRFIGGSDIAACWEWLSLKSSGGGITVKNQVKILAAPESKGID